jgi:hypothetical protein
MDDREQSKFGDKWWTILFHLKKSRFRQWFSSFKTI